MFVMDKTLRNELEIFFNTFISALPEVCTHQSVFNFIFFEIVTRIAYILDGDDIKITLIIYI